MEKNDAQNSKSTPNTQHEPNKKSPLSTEISENIKLLKDTFENCGTLVTRDIENSIDPSVNFCIVYSDGMVNNQLINQDIIRPLLHFRFNPKAGDLIDVIAKQVTLSDSVEKTADMEKIEQAIIYGDCVLLIDGFAEVLLLNTKGWNARSITEPDDERVLRGPREGFTEALMVNLSLIRRKLRTPDLKMEYKTFGTRSKTKACICYLGSLVNKDVLAELEERLEKFTIDGTLDVNYITEMIRDSPSSPIKTIGSTERPDVIAAKLLEGRVALFLDGTPVVLTMPIFFIENFQSDDDYYLNYYFASIGRILRMIAFFISTSLPAIYVALVSFHQEMLPTPLLISISMARQGVPFPTIVEAIGMMAVFEILRESGSRMPSMMGQALSIVGSLVMGQAAVEAKIVSAPIIIIAAASGISGLMVSRLKGPIILLRLLFLMSAGILGLYGYMFAVLAMFIHLYNLNSFGIPIMSDATASGFQDNKDLYVRAPWWLMKKRPKYLTNNQTRLSTKDDTQ